MDTKGSHDREANAVLLTRIRAGDGEALARLVEDTWDGLVGHLTGITGSREAAEDAAQEALVRLWEHRERWHRGSARALLFRIARNVALDAGRRERVRRRWRAQEAEGYRPTPETPEDAARLSECQERYLQALHALSPRRREVFELIRFQGLSYREAAQALDLAEQTVANRMSLALADLRTLLADVLPGVHVSRDVSRRGGSDG